MFPPRFAQKSVAFAVFSGSDCAVFPLSAQTVQDVWNYVCTDPDSAFCLSVSLSPYEAIKSCVSSQAAAVRQSVHITSCRPHQTSNLFHKWILCSRVSAAAAGRFSGCCHCAAFLNPEQPERNVRNAGGM